VITRAAFSSRGMSDLGPAPLRTPASITRYGVSHEPRDAR
jgi:hypothetical protein